MNPLSITLTVAGYFLLLILLGYITARKGDNTTFFTANRNSPWWLVAFGMVGTTISGVTFVSVPGEVGAKAFSYMQIVFGYFLGYIFIAYVLLPVYYRLQLTSIYTYLKLRFGNGSYKVGALFFLISRTLGSALRLFLAIKIFQIFIFDQWGVPFNVSVIISVILILLYSAKGGIRTIIYTDTLQTIFFLTALVITIIYIGNSFELDLPGIVRKVSDSSMSKIFTWDWRSPDFFWKQFLSGIFITIAMTGLDQEMMQKNLTCRSLKDAQKNMMVFSAILVGVNLLFLGLGALMFMYADFFSIQLPINHATGAVISDNVFPTLAINHFPPIFTYVFIIGLTAAAFGGADAALASLTTSFCIDFLEMDERSGTKRDVRRRKLVHAGFAVLTILCIWAFPKDNGSVISILFKIAAYTYGPLLGLYLFGLFTKRTTTDRIVPYICLAAPFATYGLEQMITWLLPSYKFGFEALVLNAAIVCISLWITGGKKIRLQPAD